MDEISIRALELAVQGRDASEPAVETVRRAGAFRAFLLGQPPRITTASVGGTGGYVNSSFPVSG